MTWSNILQIFTTVAQALILQCLRIGVLGVHVWEMSVDNAIYETTVRGPLQCYFCNIDCPTDFPRKLIECTTLIVIP